VPVDPITQSRITNTFPIAMRKLVLSDHTQDQSNAAAHKRQEDYERAFADYENALAQRAQYGKSLSENSRRLLRDRRYFAWIFSFIPRLLNAVSSDPSAPMKVQAGRDEMVWNAGSDGEQRVLDALSGQLGDECVAISGYRNPSGEIDLLLVCPDGVLAIEIKYVNGKVYCDGDRWWRDKSDKYGNVVERNLPIADRKGRGPSAQVNASAGRLQRFLAERTPVTVVLRSVVLSHPQSSIGDMRYQTVDEISTLDAFDPREVFKRTVGTGHQLPVDDLVRTIAQDHCYHESRLKR